ncbi:MAG: 5-methylphenazine-carboxylate 1-monooxygenase [Gaiellales bacterium]|jgi:2-polyprenyl-6-methoxyphenol hydroxylase-like FAD-dependent oxidoreductase|nr:5-methylphenazine-carboxylate 1-monooxygenase [Gaiellales bacterium]
MSSRREIMIAGGGIGGLTAALALQRRGIEATVFEAARQIRPLGVGINLLPHSVRVLSALGLQDELAATAIETAELAYFNRHGQPIWSEPRGRGAGYDFPQFSVHRGELQLLLERVARERLGPDRVICGHALADFETVGHDVIARFVRRGEHVPDHLHRGQALVGADGIHSRVRARLHPGEGPPRYAGRMLWRALSRGPRFLTGRSMIMAGHQDQKFVCYPISAVGAEDDGESLINWIAELAVPGDTPPPQDWSRRVDASVFCEPFAEWRFDWLDVPTLIAGADEIYEYPLADRDPLDHWGAGPVTLLGDAAHPMFPIGSNGASQAILDAEALADALARTTNIESALAEYERMRRGPTSQIVLANRQNGPERVMQLAEDRAPGGFERIEDVIPRDELEQIAASYKAIAGFAPEQVNTPGT